MNGKYKNYSFWTALAGAVVVFLNAIGDCFGFSIDNELVSGLIMSVAGLLVVFGVVTMPTNNKENGEVSENLEQEEKQESNKDEIKDNKEIEEKNDENQNSILNQNSVITKDDTKEDI